MKHISESFVGRWKGDDLSMDSHLPLVKRFTTGCLISQISVWVLVYTKTSTKKPLGWRRDVRKA